MGRDDGFGIADVSTKHLDDDKVRKLWRLLGPDVSAMCEAITLHLAVVLASWGSGRRMTVDEAAPLWLPVSETSVVALVEVGLLDRSKRLPSRSWATYFGPAKARREARVASGRSGGLAKAKRTSSDARATLYPSGRQAGPSSPSVPSVRPKRATRPAPESGGSAAPVPFAEGMAAAGYDPRVRKGGDR